ncbi:hypothetical protein MHBO_002673 [Bonamia ostreae]|uniref:Transmembrane protein n=1 Tax=Bonamia ostreae TaxID=126728 RepID=A0ABV2AN38_9EUKA
MLRPEQPTYSLPSTLLNFVFLLVNCYFYKTIGNSEKTAFPMSGTKSLIVLHFVGMVRFSLMPWLNFLFENLRRVCPITALFFLCNFFFSLHFPSARQLMVPHGYFCLFVFFLHVFHIRFWEDLVFAACFLFVLRLHFRLIAALFRSFWSTLAVSASLGAAVYVLRRGSVGAGEACGAARARVLTEGRLQVLLSASFWAIHFCLQNILSSKES